MSEETTQKPRENHVKTTHRYCDAGVTRNALLSIGKLLMVKGKGRIDPALCFEITQIIGKALTCKKREVRNDD